ncbi:hypothetical protein B5G09_11860 [Alistipes sp. An54]|nr:hypothetical protein B5G09_11860 [Alistipes sp. An54]
MEIFGDKVLDEQQLDKWTPFFLRMISAYGVPCMRESSDAPPLCLVERCNDWPIQFAGIGYRLHGSGKRRIFQNGNRV